jgi:hypothetical protein
MSAIYPGGKIMSELIEDFNQGDLLYGETCDRELYLTALDKKFTPPGFVLLDYTPRPKAPVTIDRLTSSVVEKGLKTGKTWSDLKLENPDLPADAQKFYEYAQKSRFSGKLVGTNTTNQTKTGVAKGTPLTKPFLRSKCKAGIEFVVEQGYTVRFVLDSLTEVRLKSIFKNELTQPWYTGTELRSIYKHRGKFGNKVVFYRSGSRCKAPWEDYPDIIPR